MSAMTPERLAELREEIAHYDNHWAAQGPLEELLAEVERLAAERIKAVVASSSSLAAVEAQVQDLYRERARVIQERDTALLEAAARLRDDDAWDGFQVRVYDLAAKWAAMAGDGRDKRSSTLGACSRALLELARL